MNDKVVWDRAEEGGFPETKELKQRVRDILSPFKYLGHSDNKKDNSLDSGDDDENDDDDDMDDEGAEEMRRFYGVM